MEREKGKKVSVGMLIGKQKLASDCYLNRYQPHSQASSLCRMEERLVICIDIS